MLFLESLVIYLVIAAGNVAWIVSHREHLVATNFGEGYVDYRGVAEVVVFRTLLTGVFPVIIVAFSSVTTLLIGIGVILAGLIVATYFNTMADATSRFIQGRINDGYRRGSRD